MDKAARKQTIKLMFYTLVAFSAMFAIFAMLIYFQISNTLFDPVRKDILETQEIVMGNDSFIEMQLSFPYLDEDGQMNSFKDGFKDGPKDYLTGDKPPSNDRKQLPFRVDTIVRDSNGNVVNSYALGHFAWGNSVEEIPFSASEIETFGTITTSNGAVYENYTFIMDYNNSPYYIQLLSNVDGEQGVLNSIMQYLLYGSVICVILAIIISYVLSQYSIKPIIRSWNRQSEFVENASHELRTPLTIIQNKLENLLTSPYETILDNSDSIGVVLNETQRLSKLTTDLMTLARSDSGETLIVKEDFNVDDLIRQVCEPYGEIAAFDDKTLTLQLDYKEDLHADRLRIHEALVILLDNALKYTKTGASIDVITYKKQNKFVFKIEDTGIGLSQANYKKVFQRFYREDAARAMKNNSSGLGLPIAKWIITQHGGSISIYRENGKTVVKFTI